MPEKTNNVLYLVYEECSKLKRTAMCVCMRAIIFFTIVFLSFSSADYILETLTIIYFTS